MKVDIFIIAKGNTTALVSEHGELHKKDTIKKLLTQVEQVGFLYKEKKPKLVMMGEELCINAVLAFASTLGKKGHLEASGLKEKVSFTNTKKYTKITITLPFKKNKNSIIFDGIGFVILPKKNKQDISKKTVAQLCKKYKLPAFGIILYKDEQIFPIIYVQKTNSFVTETSCGSGSIAFSIYTGIQKVIQPTGEIIEVTKKGETFSIRTNVAKIHL